MNPSQFFAKITTWKRSSRFFINWLWGKTLSSLLFSKLSLKSTLKIWHMTWLDLWITADTRYWIVSYMESSQYFVKIRTWKISTIFFINFKFLTLRSGSLVKVGRNLVGWEELVADYLELVLYTATSGRAVIQDTCVHSVR